MSLLLHAYAEIKTCARRMIGIVHLVPGVVHGMDRLARNLDNLCRIAQKLNGLVLGGKVNQTC